MNFNAVEKPPFYFSILNRLNGNGEYGESVVDRGAETGKYTAYMLNQSVHRESYVEAWREFIKGNPEDPAAVFVNERLAPEK